ncbi:MAG TPA: bifunctional nuclease domain-containing protein [Mycobacteriales bacterium]|nr:bifunctional nuclease domain-containing protein [Mycobacteriales bacterium]
MGTRNDADLVHSARAGDKAAFGELLARHVRTAEALAARILPGDLAGDAAQEAALLALTGLDRLRAPERFGAWLGGIALNVARRWVRGLHDVDLLPDGGPADAGPRPDAAVELTLLRERVRQAVADLAPGQRTAVFLFYLQGLTHREVADELQISVGAVKSRLHQGRAALATQLAAELTPVEQEPTMTEVPVTIAQILRRTEGSPGHRNHVVVLNETGGDRRLAIWIGEAVAVTLAISLEGEQMPRPMTYQFAASLLDAGGAAVREVVISRLEGSIYYASTVIDGPAGERRIDARPSDALNLAVLAGAPIRLDESLFAETELDAAEWEEIYPAAASEVVEETRAQFSR